jgi:hypothetical protein
MAHCKVCEFVYDETFSDDARGHRNHHRGVMEILRAKPDPRLASLHAKHGTFVPAHIERGRWLNTRLYKIARAFRVETQSGVMWGLHPDDNTRLHGWLIADGEGRALGGFGLCPREYRGWGEFWLLTWIWVAPPYRRRGWMRRAWEMIEQKYPPPVVPDKPFAKASAAFFQPRFDAAIALLNGGR